MLLAFQRSLLVKGKNTRPVTIATAIEVTVIAGVLLLAIFRVHMVGVLAAALAAVSGRFAPFFIFCAGYAAKKKNCGLPADLAFETAGHREF